MRTTLLIAVLGLACVAPLTTSAATPDPQTSYDGLQRRESKVFSDLWVRKYFDVRSYHKVMFAAPSIQYRPVMKGEKVDANAPQPAPLTKRQKESLQQIVDKAFREELSKSKYFKLTDEPGLDVLTVRGDLVDVVSFIPANASGKNDPLTVPEVGQATLVLELYDSTSDAIMVRASEQVAPKKQPETKTAAEAVEATAKEWATLLRERLDAAASIPLNPDTNF